MKVLIAPDKFKGTLSAEQAAEAVARGWREGRPKDSLDLLPITDGGDGFGPVMRFALKAECLRSRTVDATGALCNARWWYDRPARTAIIESAGVIGLAMLPPGVFPPSELDTRGLATILRQAKAEGAKRCIVGIGGSATNDGGFGVARALGWRFLDESGQDILSWTKLSELRGLVPPEIPRWPEEIVVAVDVQNPLLGSKGATAIYGPQKGLKAKEIPVAEACLKQLERCFAKWSGKSLAGRPGTGAAGGLGFGLLAFLGGHIERGFDLFAKVSGLEKRLANADLVLTGEGSIDASTFMGKGVGELALLCKKHRIPCVGLAGAVDGNNRVNKVFSRASGLTEITSKKNAMTQPSLWMEHLAKRAALEWNESARR